MLCVPHKAKEGKSNFLVNFAKNKKLVLCTFSSALHLLLLSSDDQDQRSLQRPRIELIGSRSFLSSFTQSQYVFHLFRDRKMILT